MAFAQKLRLPAGGKPPYAQLVAYDAPPSASGSSVVEVINPITSDKKGRGLVVVAPHISSDGLNELGLVNADGSLIEGVAPHETHDLHLSNIIEALVRVAKNDLTIVTSKVTRLGFEAGRIADFDLVVATTTPGGVPIPAYQGPDGEKNRRRAFENYREYRDAAEKQIDAGDWFVGSVDTFTPISLKGDLGGPRDMAISIIATQENLELASEIQKSLLKRLKGQVDTIQNGTDYKINQDRLVTINEPYGAQVAHRQLAFEKGKNGLIFEFRQDLAADPAKAALFAKTLWETLEEIHALKNEAHSAYQPARHGQAEIRRPSALAGLKVV